MPQKPFLQGLSLALATDSTFQRGILPGILRSAGALRIDTLRNAEDLNDVLATGIADVVIVDDRIGEVDGLEVVHSIRRSSSSDIAFLPIIYLMANPTRKKVMDTAKAGVHEVVTKPYSARTLLDRLYWPVRFPRQFIHNEDYFGPAPRTVLHRASDAYEARPSNTLQFDLDEIHCPSDEMAPMAM